MKKNLMFAGMLFVTGLSQFTAQEKEGTIPEITIAAKSKQQLYKTGKNVQLITSKDLEKFKGQSTAEILNQVSGFQITGNFNNNSEPKSLKIRGGKMANLLVLIDGVPLKDVTGNDYNASDLRLFASENIESIEILNGSSSVLYGSNATVSVINIKTKKSAQKPVEARIGARVGSFGTFAQNALINGKIEKFNYQISGYNEKSDGISAASGKNFDKDGYEKQNVNANFGFSTDNFNINLNGGYLHNLYDYDKGAFNDGISKGNDSQIFGGLNAQYQYSIGNINFNSRISRNEREHSGIDSWDNYSYNGQNIFAELYNQTRFSEYVNVVTGLQYETQNMGSKSIPFGKTELEDVLKLKDTKIANFDVFANANLQYQIFHLDLGARLNNHSKYNNHFVYSVNPFVLKEFDNLFIKAGYSYATAFIAPTLYQNYGSLPFVLSNFDIKPETNDSHEIDINIGKKDRTLVFNASLYQRNEKDLIIFKTNQFKNLDSNKTKGFELGFNYTLNKHVNLGGNFSFTEKDKDNAMLRIPKQRVNAFVEVLPFTNNRINLSYQYISKRKDTYYDAATFANKNAELDAFHLFNLNINQKIANNLEAYLNIGNLLNASYIDVVGYNTKPRNYALGIDYKF